MPGGIDFDLEPLNELMRKLNIIISKGKFKLMALCPEEEIRRVLGRSIKHVEALCLTPSR